MYKGMAENVLKMGRRFSSVLGRSFTCRFPLCLSHYSILFLGIFKLFTVANKMNKKMVESFLKTCVTLLQSNYILYVFSKCRICSEVLFLIREM